MRGLDGKVAVVTGAARGIGLASARRLAREGVTVVATDILDERLHAELSGVAALTAHLDVTSESDWSARFGAVADRFGRLDVLVNNAGISGALRPFPETSLDEYLTVIGVNQVGVFLGMRAAVPLMRASGGGVIVNISSVHGIGGRPYLLPYVASKFAVRGMTKSAALELGPDNIRVNSVHPGYIDTPMLRAATTDGTPIVMDHGVLPAGRLGNPEEVANLVVFLASEEGAYCTGAEFVVDGGLTAGRRGAAR